MKKRSKILLGFLGIVGIGAIAIGGVVSCSNNSSSSSNTTNNGNNSTTTTISGSSFTELSTNWNKLFTNYKTTNYSDWMKANLTQYAKNAPTYFDNLANLYWTVHDSKPISSQISTNYLPYTINFSSKITPDIPTTLASTTSSVSSSSSTQTSTSQKTTTVPTPVKSSPLPNVPSSVIPDSDENPQIQKAISYLSLQSVKLSDFSMTNNLFNFTLTWTYSEYTESPKEISDLPTASTTNVQPTLTKSTSTITENIVDGSFSSTILGSGTINDLFNTKNANVNVTGGWYLSSCKSNTFTFEVNKDNNQSSSNKDTNKATDTNNIVIAADTSSSKENTNAANNTNDTTFAGATTFLNPSSSTLLNAPIVTNTYNNALTISIKKMKSLNDSISASSKGLEKSNVSTSGIKDNYWLNNLVLDGISGYAYDSASNLINSTNSIKNVDESLLSNLKSSNLSFDVTENITVSIPKISSSSETNFPLVTSGSNKDTFVPTKVS